MAPEVIAQREYDGKADIWSLGIMLVEVVEGRPPYADAEPHFAMQMIIERGTPVLREAERLTRELKNFMAMCLTVDTRSRASAEELIYVGTFLSTVMNVETDRDPARLLKDRVHHRYICARYHGWQ
jgi:serine/threonine protein kinase